MSSSTLPSLKDRLQVSLSPAFLWSALSLFTVIPSPTQSTVSSPIPVPLTSRVRFFVQTHLSSLSLLIVMPFINEFLGELSQTPINPSELRQTPITPESVRGPPAALETNRSSTTRLINSILNRESIGDLPAPPTSAVVPQPRVRSANDNQLSTQPPATSVRAKTTAKDRNAQKRKAKINA